MTNSENPLPSGRGEVKTLVNLTPHAVRVHTWQGVLITELPITRSDVYYQLGFESAEPATVRVDDSITALGEITDASGHVIPVNLLERSEEITGYPPPKPGVAYVVSRIAAEQIAAIDGAPRPDILIPGPEIRDASGRITGCKGLSSLASRTPAERQEATA